MIFFQFSTFNNQFIQQQTMQDTCFKSALEVLKWICYSTIKDRLHSFTVTLGNTLTVPNIYIIYNFQISIIYVIKWRINEDILYNHLQYIVANCGYHYVKSISYNEYSSCVVTCNLLVNIHTNTHFISVVLKIHILYIAEMKIYRFTKWLID